MQSILQLKLMKEKPLTTNIVCRSMHIVLTNSNIIEFLFHLNISWRDPLLLAWPQSLWMPWPCIEVCLEMTCGRDLSHLGWMELMFFFFNLVIYFFLSFCKFQSSFFPRFNLTMLFFSILPCTSFNFFLLPWNLIFACYLRSNLCLLCLL